MLKPYWFSFFNSLEKEISSVIVVANSKEEAEHVIEDFIAMNEIYGAKKCLVHEFTLDFINQAVEIDGSGVLLYEESEVEENEGFFN